jgi:hypothetical protein
VDFAEYDDIIRRLTAMLVKQDEYNARQEQITAHQRSINERLTASMEHLDAALERQAARQEQINERLTAAIERIDTVLQRLVRGSGNGREA